MATNASFPLPTPTPIQRMLSPFRRFIHAESSGGIVLLLAAILALLWANSPWWATYHHLWESYLSVGFMEWDFSMSLHHFINDGLMAVFFFLVGLEIKREMLVGELASVRAAALPIAAAVGGMMVPAAVYMVFNAGGEGAAGWGIPMATDIAFALGILALMGPQIPVGLKVFLAALAIVDDLGAVLVIALFYTADVNLGALEIGALILVVLAAMNQLGVRHPGAYAFVGLFLWGAVFASGVHATVAGVLAAMAVPARTRIDTDEFSDGSRDILNAFDRAGAEGEDVLTSPGQQAAIQALETNCEAAQSPLQRIEHDLHPWVAFGIVPLFALANAGVRLTGNVGEALVHPVTLGVIFGLIIGKPIGITLFSWLALRSGAAVLPDGVDMRAVVGVGFLAGIGFTMSLFIAALGFGDGSPMLDAAKMGILVASALAAGSGWVLLKRVRSA